MIFLKMLQALCFCDLKTEMIRALDDMDSFYMHFKSKKNPKTQPDFEKDGWW